MAERICTSHSIHNVMGDENNVPHIPKIKEGPALLQKRSRCSASFLTSVPERYCAEMQAAPTGYPPNKPAISIPSQPVGIPKTLHNGFKKAGGKERR